MPLPIRFLAGSAKVLMKSCLPVRGRTQTGRSTSSRKISSGRSPPAHEVIQGSWIFHSHFAWHQKLVTFSNENVNHENKAFLWVDPSDCSAPGMNAILR